LPWIVLFIVSALPLAIATRYFFDWKKLNIQGSGRVDRLFSLAKSFCSQAMGDVGSMILWPAFILSALIL